MKIVDFVKLPEIISDGIWSNDFIEKELSQLSENCEYIVVKKESLTGKNKETILEECDIDSINRFIEMARIMNKNIKLVFDFGNVKAYNSGVNKEYYLLNKIIDLNYISFFNKEYKDDEFKVEILSGENVKKSYDTLILCCKDIKESDLSPFEKLLSCYNIAKSFKKYNDSKFELSSSSRALPLILNNDYEVCTGYANMFSFLCCYCGIDTISYTDYKSNHQVAYSNIEDDKYDVHGYFKFDPTSDNSEENIIYDNYSYFGTDIKKIETVLDRFLSVDFDEAYEIICNNDGLESKLLEKYIKGLEPSFNELDGYELYKKFHRKFLTQEKTFISRMTIEKASIALDEFISQRKYSEEEKIRLALDNYDMKVNENYICIQTDDEREKLKYSLALLDKNGFGKLSQIVLNYNDLLNNKTKFDINDNICSITSDNTKINGIVFPRNSIEYREFCGYYLRECLKNNLSYSFIPIKENNMIIGSNLIFSFKDKIIFEMNGLNTDEMANIICSIHEFENHTEKKF